MSATTVALATVMAAGSAPTKSNSPIGTYVFLAVILFAGYFLFLRPARARQKKALETRAEIGPGVEVTTTAGLIANVTAVDDATVTLEIAPGVHARFLKAAIVRVNTPEPEMPAADESPDTPDTSPDPTSGDATPT